MTLFKLANEISWNITVLGECYHSVPLKIKSSPDNNFVITDDTTDFHSDNMHLPHCWDKMILWLSYLHNGMFYTGKITYLY